MANDEVNTHDGSEDDVKGDDDGSVNGAAD